MNIDSNGHLLAIGVQNFQSIKDFTWIPLGKLTLLFGPNSAGKSLVADALKVIQAIWRGDAERSEYQGWARPVVEEITSRHWHRATGADIWSDDDQPDPRVTIKASAILKVRGLFELGEYEEASHFARSFHRLLIGLEPPRNQELHITVSSVLERTRRPMMMGGHREDWLILEVEVEGNPLLRSESCPTGMAFEEVVASINLRHPLLLEDAIEQELDGLAGDKDEWVRLRDGWLELNSEGQLLPGNVLLFTSIPDIYGKEFRAAQILRTLHDFIMGAIGRSVSTLASLGHVPASRTIPSRRELFYQFENQGERVIRSRPDGSLVRLGLALKLDIDGDERFEALAQKLAESEMRASGELNSDDEAGRSASVTEEDLGLFVNRMLLEPLFKEKGYQIRARLWGVSRYPERFDTNPLLVQLSLVDSARRQFNFDDVGSGLGYVLPVLVKGFQFPQAFIEQPELHLHPALQSRMGDVLIEMVNAGRRLIVETHSEHIILRLLRRIRQSTEQTAVAPYPLSVEDIVVLYFEPSPAGPSHVRQLRIASDGEFLDPWPKGFFDSRDEDLFDE